MKPGLLEQTTNPMMLNKGLKLRLPADMPVESVTINSGTYLVPSQGNEPRCILPKPDWRQLTQEEYDRLVSIQDVSLQESVSVINVDEQLRTVFEAHIARQLFGQHQLAPDQAKVVLEGFAQQAAQSLQIAGWSVRPVVCNATINPPNLPSTAFDFEHGSLVGLHFDNRETDFHLIAFNLGTAHRYLNFVNLERKALVNWPGLKKADVTSNLTQLRNLFFARYPEYPVVRIRLNPLQAYALNPQSVIHDGATNESGVPDVNFLMLSLVDQPH